MKISAANLLAECIAARQGGADFPQIWNDILKRHSLVTGIPTQASDSDRPALEIRLLDGQHLVFDSRGGFSLR